MNAKNLINQGYYLHTAQIHGIVHIDIQQG